MNRPELIIVQDTTTHEIFLVLFLLLPKFYIKSLRIDR